MLVVISRADSTHCLVSWLTLVNFSQSNIELSYLVLKSNNNNNVYTGKLLKYHCVWLYLAMLNIVH